MQNGHNDDFQVAQQQYWIGNHFEQLSKYRTSVLNTMEFSKMSVNLVNGLFQAERDNELKNGYEKFSSEQS